MNIFPTNLQFFLLKHFKNKKEIIKLYTDQNYENEELIGYYYPKKIKLDKYLFNDAVWCGNIRLMKWLLESGCPWNDWTFRYAAEHGNLENMKWLKTNGCPWNDWTFRYAAEHGNLENMKWLKTNGCPWNDWTFTYAAEHGSLENMKWLLKKCPLEYDYLRNIKNWEWIKEKLLL
jgi:hypothetical protein